MALARWLNRIIVRLELMGPTVRGNLVSWPILIAALILSFGLMGILWLMQSSAGRAIVAGTGVVHILNEVC